jgi:hypothetical protein
MCEIHTVARDGKRRKMAALPIEFLHGWLFGITESQVKEEYREKITLYRRECFTVLSAAFQADRALPEPTSSKGESGMTLAQIRDLGAALMQMAEQQMALEGRVDETHALATQAHGRLDKAADVMLSARSSAAPTSWKTSCTRMPTSPKNKRPTSRRW